MDKTDKTIKCRFCKAEDIKKDGKRKTNNRGLIQRYKCLKCGKRFVLDDGFFRMRNAPNKITLCLDLFYRGISTRKIQEHLQAFYPHNSHYSNIYRWVVKYAEKISQFTTKLNLNVGNEIQVDEMEYKTKVKKRILIWCIKIFLVVVQFIGFRYGISILTCIFKLNQSICNSGELNYIVFGVGIFIITLSIVTYLYVLLAKDIKIKTII